MTEKEILQILNESCRNTLVEHLGIEYTAVEDGNLIAKMPLDHRTCRPDGAEHGGANMALAETIAGAMSYVSVGENSRNNVFGIEINGNHMKQAKGSYVIAKGRFIHKGRKTHVIEVEIRDEFNTLVTISRVTNVIV